MLPKTNWYNKIQNKIQHPQKTSGITFISQSGNWTQLSHSWSTLQDEFLMCVLPNAPTALINKHPNENLARLELLKKRPVLMWIWWTLHQVFYIYYYFSICDVSRVSQEKGQNQNFSTRLGKNKSEEWIFWNVFSLSCSSCILNLNWIIIMEKHCYTDKAPLLRCAVSTRLFRIKKQLQVALMYNSSSGNWTQLPHIHS